MIALDLRNTENTLSLLADALAPTPNAVRQLEVDTRRDDLVDLLERHAEHTDENGRVWIDVQVAVDLVMDLPDGLASVRPEPTESTDHS